MHREIENCQRCHRKTREEIYCLECQRVLQMEEIAATWDDAREEPDEVRTQTIDRCDREKSDAGLE